eukprot:TRINITY_DN21213_c0_g1_i1.p1 TRINITY_DN21213_c0_g1~~TRINITY_DN21213_c0_g1_i1.p1  ORF type:complete len:170 (+),score=30.45 TRINITY_DN21213_c0_g1_i1:118-627(+)
MMAAAIEAARSESPAPAENGQRDSIDLKLANQGTKQGNDGMITDIAQPNFGNTSRAKRRLSSCGPEDDKSTTAEITPQRARRMNVTWSPQLISQVCEMHSAAAYDRSLISADQYSCDGCGYFIIGDRWHCTMCDNYDICDTCYKECFEQKVDCKHGKTIYVCIQEGALD